MSKLVEIKTNTNESIKVASIKADIISKIIEIAPMCDKIDYIYLFGSSLEERCTDRSDIDLAIVSNVTRSRLYSNKSYDNFTSALYNLGTDQDYDILQFNSLSKLQNSKDYVCNEILTKGKVIYTRKEIIMEATKNNKDNLIIFEEPIYIKANDVEKIYPHSKYVMTDLVIEEDDADTAGYLVAVSTDEDSYDELVELRHYLAENGLNTALLGFYGGYGPTVFTRIVRG